VIFRLDHRLIFPPPQLAEDNGVLAVGGDLSEDRLILAYSSGIFPWPHEGLPLLWHSPDPRTVLVPKEIHVGRSLEKQIRRGTYEVRFDTAFRQVMRGCSQKERPDQDGTWITDEMIEGYVALHRRGLAHSIEAWRGDELVGGLYGVSLGGAFFGESMFAEAPDASKVAFATLVRQLDRWGFDFVDCQVHTEHLERFGAVEWPRTRFLAALKKALKKPNRVGPWTLDPPAP
jgi:leucyl/phenylalanyl-tRNA--protein transferase